MRLGQFPFYISKRPHASLALPVFIAVIVNQNPATLGNVRRGMAGCWEAEKCLFCRHFSLKPDMPRNGGHKSVAVGLIWVIPDASLGSSDRQQRLLRAGCEMCCWPNCCKDPAGLEERDGPFNHEGLCCFCCFLANPELKYLMLVSSSGCAWDLECLSHLSEEMKILNVWR